MVCNTCQYEWDVSIISNINHKSSSPSCSKLAPWTLDRCIKTSQDIHGNKYDYSLITHDHIHNNKSKVKNHLSDFKP